MFLLSSWCFNILRLPGPLGAVSRPEELPDGSPPRAKSPEAVEPAVEPQEPAAEAVEESAGVGTQLGLSKNWGIFF